VPKTPTKSTTLDDIRALEAGCAAERPLDLRDRAIDSILKTTAARNSGMRLLRLEDLDFEPALIRFRRGKGDKTLDVALQPDSRAATTPGWEPAHARLPPDPTCHSDPPRQQRDAARRRQALGLPYPKVSPRSSPPAGSRSSLGS
jgi:integrase